MAKVKKSQIEEEVVEVNEDLELEDLDVEDLDVEEIDVEEDSEGEEVDEIEQELEEAAKPKKEKKEKKAKGSGLKSTAALAEDEVGAAYVADLCGVEARELRGFLRKNYRNMDEEKSMRYRWKKDDPQIQEIVDAFKAHKRGASEKKKAEKKAEEAPKTVKKANKK